MERRALGQTGLEVGRLGMASSYGVSARAVEQAFERGVNYLYWGSLRARPFGQGIRAALARAQRREDLVVVVQTYSRVASLIRPSVERRPP